MMKSFHLLQSLNSYLQELVGGPLMIAAVLLTGCYLTLRLQWPQLRYFTSMLQHCLCHRSAGQRERRYQFFQALTTALAATIGTGNIAGVAAAITLGGPGAVFWLWFSAFLGMVTKYAEVVLAVHYRHTRAAGDAVGGPMYFLAKGLNSQVLAALFALFGSLAAFGIGNMVQANSVAAAMHEAFNVSQLQTGLIMAAITAAVIIGGISGLLLLQKN